MPTDFPHPRLRRSEAPANQGFENLEKRTSRIRVSANHPCRPSRLSGINRSVAAPGHLSQLYSRIPVRARGRVARHYTISSISNFLDAGQRVAAADRSGSIGFIFSDRMKRLFLHAITAKGAKGIDKIALDR